MKVSDLCSKKVKTLFYASVTLKELEVETLSHIRPACGKESSFSAGVSWRDGKHPSLTISPDPQRGCHFPGLLRSRALFSLVREPNHGPDLFSSTAVVAVCSHYCSRLSHYWWVMVMDSPAIVSVGSIPWGNAASGPGNRLLQRAKRFRRNPLNSVTPLPCLVPMKM